MFFGISEETIVEVQRNTQICFFFVCFVCLFVFNDIWFGGFTNLRSLAHWIMVRWMMPPIHSSWPTQPIRQIVADSENVRKCEDNHGSSTRAKYICSGIFHVPLNTLLCFLLALSKLSQTASESIYGFWVYIFFFPWTCHNYSYCLGFRSVLIIILFEQAKLEHTGPGS